MLKIGTRGSLLATTQAGHVRDALIAHGYPSELEIVTTLGDVNMAPVERIGVGVFTQALRDALASGVCDVAVHSFKDLPTAVDERFQLIVPKREDPRDCLIARDGLKFAELPPNAVIGTSAPRRIAQLKAMRPDIITAARVVLGEHVVSDEEFAEDKHLAGLGLPTQSAERSRRGDGLEVALARALTRIGVLE